MTIINEYDYNSLIETFVSQQYLWLVQNLKPNTTAIDIGAQCGDSAIFLAQQPEISRVFAFDSDLQVYERAKGIMAKARSSVQKKVSYGLAEITNTESALRQKKFHIWQPKMPALSLKDILEHNAGRRLIIKCDCEGAEHTIFNDDFGSALNSVYKLQIEYHNGVKNLKNVLEKYGYKVEVAPPWTIDKKLGEVGWLYAKK